MSDEHSHEWVEKRKLVLRGRRMHGQAGAVVRMIEDDRSCAEVLQQVVAMISAAEELAVLVLQDHVLSRCGQGGTDGQELAQELGSYLRRVVRR
jgi:DNA-binding FrmR family transcriptional regulator